MPEKENYSQGLKILKAKVAVFSNEPSLLLAFPLRVEVPSLLTDFREVVRIPTPAHPDGSIHVWEAPTSRPLYRLVGSRALFRGPFVNLTHRSSDPRFSLWGNLGFLYRFALYLLEKKHRIWNLHACALFDRPKDRLYVVAGGAGSGKTIFLLSGLERGLELFSTETVHFTHNGGRFRWFMGSLIDNVRTETLQRYFPHFWPPRWARNELASWIGKIAIDLSSYQCPRKTLIDPEVVILLPRVEAGRRSWELTPLTNPCRAARAVFDNISQKLAETVLLYDVLPVTGIDSIGLARARWQAVEKLVGSEKTRLVASVLSSPRHCWGNLLSYRPLPRRGK